MTLVVMACVAGAVVHADDSSADSASSASIDMESVAATEAKITAKLIFESNAENFSSVKYSAKLVNSSGTTQSSALSSSSGTFTKSSVSEEITVTLPSTAGTYRLQVTWTETDGSETKEISSEKSVDARQPITLSVTVKNTGSLAVNNASVYFYVDNKKIDDSEQSLTVEAGKEATVTYKYFDKNLSHGEHKFALKTSDTAYNLVGLDKEFTFYYEQGNMNYMTYIIVIVLILIVIFAVWVFRKPVKNYGKPKARR